MEKVAVRRPCPKCGTMVTRTVKEVPVYNIEINI